MTNPSWARLLNWTSPSPTPLRCRQARKPQVNDALRATNGTVQWVQRRTIQGALKDVTAPLRREVRVSLKVLTGGRHVRAISL